MLLRLRAQPMLRRTAGEDSKSPHSSFGKKVSFMSDQGTPAGDVEGKRFLYDAPELLTVEAHGALGLSPIEAPYAFAAKAQAVPIAMSEFRSVQRHYPIIFAGNELPSPLAVLGTDGENYFVDAAGQWEPGVYIPAYLRIHPLALANTGDDRFAVVIDRASKVVQENPEIPFFENGELSEAMKPRLDFVQAFDAEITRTKQFCERLKALDLVASQQVAWNQNESSEDIARYGAVNPEKLSALSAEDFTSLRNDGSLAGIFAHVFSLDLWNDIMRRREARRQASAQESQNA